MLVCRQGKDLLLHVLIMKFNRCGRYFEGVQGDKSKQGELFGIRNIFKLHETTLATKMAVRMQSCRLVVIIDNAYCSDRARERQRP